MAGSAGANDTALSLLEQARQKPGRVSFFQLLRRLEAEASDKPRLGETAVPADDAIHIGQDPSASFHAAPIAGVSYHQGVPWILTTFLGLLGPHGPMPLHLTEFARDRLHNSGDPTLVRFLDMLQHRILCLFYRAWANTQPTVERDRPAGDRFRLYVGSLVGVGTTGTSHRDELPDEAWLYLSGRLGPRRRNAEGLEASIGEVLGAPARIEEMVGEWIEVPPSELWRLGQHGPPATLGKATLGRRAWLPQAKFRVVLGPVTAEQLETLLPGRPGLARLRALVRAYVGDLLDWDLKVILDPRERTGCRLSQDARLGWKSWLGPPSDREAGAIIEPMARGESEHLGAAERR